MHLPLTTSKNAASGGKILLILGIFLIAINLRPSLASVGPLISHIRNATGLSNFMLGLLTSLPLIAFGVVSSLTTLFTRRFGIGLTLLGAMFLLTLGIGIRVINGVFFLYFGTVLVGIGIAFGNVLLPSITKHYFSAKAGFITSLYSGAMAIGAALAAGISIPMAENLGLGWKGAMGIWAVLAFLAFIIWIPQLHRFKKNKQNGSYLQAMMALGRNPVAWKIALFMGMQSMTFYIILAWLPEILRTRGFEAEFSGWMLSLSQATGILGSIVIPLWAGRNTHQKKIVIFLCVLETAGIAGLLFAGTVLVWFWVSLIGFVLGGCFGLALLFIVLRSKNAETTTELSGMTQSIGYLVAATGPILFGGLYDISNGWTVPLGMLFVLVLIKLYTGIGAGKPGKI